MVSTPVRLPVEGYFSVFDGVVVPLQGSARYQLPVAADFPPNENQLCSHPSMAQYCPSVISGRRAAERLPMLTNPQQLQGGSSWKVFPL